MALYNPCTTTFQIKAGSALFTTFTTPSGISISSSSSSRNCKWRRPSMENNKEDKAIELVEVEVTIDRAKAREALKQLDQQLQSLSEPQPQPPLPIKTPTGAGAGTEPGTNMEMDMDNMSSRDFFMRQDNRKDMPEISDSYLAYSAGALMLITIFYNVIFSFFIKPSIDGYQKPVVLERVALSEPDYN